MHKKWLTKKVLIGRIWASISASSVGEVVSLAVAAFVARLTSSKQRISLGKQIIRKLNNSMVINDRFLEVLDRLTDADQKPTITFNSQLGTPQYSPFRSTN